MPASWRVSAAFKPAMPPPMMAMRPWVPAGLPTAAIAAAGPLKAAAPTAAPVTFKKSRRVRFMNRRSSRIWATGRPDLSASSICKERLEPAQQRVAGHGHKPPAGKRGAHSLLGARSGNACLAATCAGAARSACGGSAWRSTAAPQVVPATGKAIWLLASPRSHQFPRFAETLFDLFVTDPGVDEEIGFGVEAPDEKVSGGRACFCDPRDIGVAAAIGNRVQAAEVEHQRVTRSDPEVVEACDVALDEPRRRLRG